MTIAAVSMLHSLVRGGIRGKLPKRRAQVQCLYEEEYFAREKDGNSLDKQQKLSQHIRRIHSHGPSNSEKTTRTTTWEIGDNEKE